MEIPKKTFEVIIDEVKEAKGVTEDIDLDEAQAALSCRGGQAG